MGSKSGSQPTRRHLRETSARATPPTTTGLPPGGGGVQHAGCRVAVGDLGTRALGGRRWHTPRSPAAAKPLPSSPTPPPCVLSPSDAAPLGPSGSVASISA